MFLARLLDYLNSSISLLSDHAKRGDSETLLLLLLRLVILAYDISAFIVVVRFHRMVIFYKCLIDRVEPGLDFTDVLLTCMVEHIDHI